MDLDDFTKEEIIAGIKKCPATFFHMDDLIQDIFNSAYSLRSKKIIDKMNINIFETKQIILNPADPNYSYKLNKWKKLTGEFRQINEKFKKLEKWNASASDEIYGSSAQNSTKHHL